MIDFGFGLSKSSTVRLDEVDLTLYRELEKLEPDVRICMGCGSCSATCTAAPWSGMSVRKVILALQRVEPQRTMSPPEHVIHVLCAPEGTPSAVGALQNIEKMLSACMLCGKCSMVCPRGINTRHLILSLCRIYKKV